MLASSEFIKVNAGNHTATLHIDYDLITQFFSNNDEYISSLVGLAIVPPANTSKVRCIFRRKDFKPISQADVALINSTFQLESGTVATAREPHTFTETYLPALDLKSVPSAKDEIRVGANGGWEKVQRTERFTGNWNFTWTNGYKNVEIVGVTIPIASIPGIIPNSPSVRVGIIEQNNNIKVTTTTIVIFEFRYADTGWTPDTYPTSTQINNYLNSLSATLIYQFVEPTITPLTNLGQLTAHPNGTIFIEPIVKQSNTHGEGIYLNSPIRWLESVVRIDGTTETLINPSNVTIRRRAGTSTAESGTTTTNIRITGHNLIVGSRIRNTTRGNVIRQVTAVVDANNVTVNAITGMTTGDSIERYTITPTNTTLPAIISVTGATSSWVYKAIYEYPSELTTVPETSISYPINMAASISTNTNMIIAVNKQVLDLNDFTVALLLNHEIRLVSLGV